METNNIILFIIVLVLFLFICKKKIMKKKRTTQKYGLTKVKNKDNVIEYYTNLPGENCGQITSEFVNQLIEKQELIRFTQEQIKQFNANGETSRVTAAQNELSRLNTEIRTLHNEMKSQCSSHSRCRVKYYGPDDESPSTVNNTICKEGNSENINNCQPASSTGSVPSEGGDGSSVSHWSPTLRPNGSRFIKFNKVLTDSWSNILISNQYMANNDVIGPEDFEYQLNQAYSYVIKYDKDNFLDLLHTRGNENQYTHSLFKNNPSYKVIDPILNIVRDRASFQNGTLTNAADINRCKDILKILFMKEELGEIYTPNEIELINDNYIEEQEDETVPAYLKSKYDEIITRVNNLNATDTLFILKNKPSNILVQSFKNIFDYCDFQAPPEVETIPNNTNDVQKLIDSKTAERYYSSGFNQRQAKIDCENKGGEFIELFKNQEDLNQKNYYCISRSDFKNQKNTYYYSYYDKSDNNKLINASDYENIDDFKNKIKERNIEKRKTGVKSGNRIFSLAFDNLCKLCDQKFDGNGILGSIFDEKSQDYKVTSCVNSKDTKNEKNYLVEPDLATKEFYTIDNNENFIKFTKVELEIENQEDMLSESEYYSSLRTPNPQ